MGSLQLIDLMKAPHKSNRTTFTLSSIGNRALIELKKHGFRPGHLASLLIKTPLHNCQPITMQVIRRSLVIDSGTLATLNAIAKKQGISRNVYFETGILKCLKAWQTREREEKRIKKEITEILQHAYKKISLLPTYHDDTCNISLQALNTLMEQLLTMA